jgi:MFS family permease
VTDQPRSPAHIPDYRRFWLTRFCSWLAGGGMAVIIGYQLYDVARQDYHMSIAKASFQLGIMGFCQFVPMFLLSLMAGVIADRFDKRNVGLMAIAVDLVVAGSLWAATGLHALSLPLLFGLGALHGLARVFIGPSVGSMAPLLVPPALLPRAVAMNSMAMQLASIIGPAGAGLLFAVHPTAPYMGAVILLAIGFLSMAGLRRLPPHPGNRDQHPVRQIAEGFTFVWNNRFLLGCITLDLSPCCSAEQPRCCRSLRAISFMPAPRAGPDARGNRCGRLADGHRADSAPDLAECRREDAGGGRRVRGDHCRLRAFHQLLALARPALDAGRG